MRNIGDKKSIEVIDSINQCKKTTFKRFIYALGISNVGEIASEKIANYFITLDQLLNTNISELKNIHGVGKIVATNILNYLSITCNREMVIKLVKKIGIFWNDTRFLIKSYKKTYFFDKRIVLTGVFTFYSRIELKKILTNLGAKVFSTICKNTDILIYGKKFGSKFFKAKSLNIKLISEKELISLI